MLEWNMEIKKAGKILVFVVAGILMIIVFSKIFEVIYALFFNWIF